MSRKKESKLGRLLSEKLGCRACGAERRLRPEKREAILRAAVAEMEKRGLSGASMDRIALRAKVSKRTVYNHFGSKEALVRTLVGEHMVRAHARVGVAYDPARRLEEQLLELARQEAEVIRDLVTDGMTRAILAECIRAPEFAKRLFEGLRKDEAGFPAWIRAAAQDGRLDAPDTEQAAEQFLALLKGKLFWPVIIGWSSAPDDAEVTQVLEESVRMFLARYGR